MRIEAATSFPEEMVKVSLDIPSGPISWLNPLMFSSQSMISNVHNTLVL